MVKPPDSELWNRARLARSRLEHDILGHPAVTMIDIGYLSGESKKADDELVLRIHVGKRWLENLTKEALPFPTEIDGFRVALVSGDYEIEST